MPLNKKMRIIYRQVILEQAANPKNRGRIEDFDHETTVYNPSCGDKIHLTMKISNNKIEKILFEGSGCTISQASASLMTSLITGKSIDEAVKISKMFSDLAIGKKYPEEEIKKLGDAQVLISIMEFPARIKCATLAWWGLDQMLFGRSEGENND
ncbi:Fe-S cluster assembly sulfur transfer protein SufU [Lactobacillus sp. LL6]|uniref:Fe-S cluster assembly sulfur transfer protein SufU n=1 Tax=Lactobacillus sp. LL6 TaxID=2596827 RepID=UPI001186A226|nr:SUF system NifU family Fe-S cluster assembly protein [Lactobacillus sp. LL6]TSO25383.1 SUF system NifU family Fe-S cluster assembly protein [Lactobacillus sp. LL6]